MGTRTWAKAIIHAAPLRIVPVISCSGRELGSDSIYCIYLQCLYEAAKGHACDIHAYVLMTNPVHLLVTPYHPDTLAKMLQSIGWRYVQYFNSTYHSARERCGKAVIEPH